MGEQGRPDLTRWRQHRLTALRDLRGSVSTVAPSGVHADDWRLLASLMPMVMEARHRLHLADVHLADVCMWDHLTLVVPSDSWLRPQAFSGAQLLGIPVRLDDRVAWPSLLWEIP